MRHAAHVRRAAHVRVQAAFRVTLRRPKSKQVPSLVPPVAATVGLAALGLAPLALLRRVLRRR